MNEIDSDSATVSHTEFEQIDLGKLHSEERYHLLTQAIVPRPIAWTLTRSKAGIFNLAPFSYFNAICSDPAIVMISVGARRAGVPKDTARNILETRMCVIHIASQIHQKDLELSATELDSEDSELRLLGFSEKDLVAQPNFALPRLPMVNLALNCVLYDEHFIGDAKQHVIYLRVETLALNRNVARLHPNETRQMTATEGIESTLPNSQEGNQQATRESRRREIDPLLLDPLARLGSGYYAGLEAIRKGRR